MVHRETQAIAQTNGTADTDRWPRFEQRMRRGVEHVYSHLDLLTLADIAHLSSHHWHRTVKRLRLHRAAGWLANAALPVTHTDAASPTLPKLSFDLAFIRDQRAREGLSR